MFAVVHGAIHLLLILILMYDIHYQIIKMKLLQRTFP